MAMIGLAIVGTVVVVAILASVIAPHDPLEQNLEDRFEGPGWKYPLGTDSLGRCIFSRIIHGSRLALMVGVLFVAVQAGIGVPIGLISGYCGGKIDSVIMRIVDIAISMPGLVLAIVFVGMFGPGIFNVILAFSITGWARFARLTRGQVLAVKEELYIEGAKSIGEKDRSILLRYIFPNTVSPIIVVMSITLPAAILAVSAMSFLGLGIMPPAPCWGGILAAGRTYLGVAPWIATFPGLAIMITVLGFNFVGDGLRDALDPRVRD